MTQTYTKQTSDYYEELTNSGMKKYSKAELDSLKENFNPPFNGGLKNDVTNSISYTNLDMILLKKI